METFSSGSEYQFVKNLRPRMFAADASYKTNKAKLMRVYYSRIIVLIHSCI